MAAFSVIGNELHTGKRSIDFIGKRKIWFSISALLIIASIVLPVLRGGFEFSIDFIGGSQFRISQVQGQSLSKATKAVTNVLGSNTQPVVTRLGDDQIQVQTFKVTDRQNYQVTQALSKAYNVSTNHVDASFISASWGTDITHSALQGLIVFLVLATIGMALYFRTWKMSVAALIALIHDLVITAGFYGAIGIQVTPSAVIGFLTILGYSLYDTVVVFDKIRENTHGYADQRRRTFSELVNLAVNQTLIRSINTSVVALLPVGSILFIGTALLGASTLEDISLALFIGILVGAYSSIFVASPLYAWLRSGETDIVKQYDRVQAARAKQAEAESSVLEESAEPSVR